VTSVKITVLVLTWTLSWLTLLPASRPALAAEVANPCGKLDAAVKKKVEWEVRTLARKFTAQDRLGNETVFAFLTNHLWKNSEIHGAAFAFAPVDNGREEVKSAPYVQRNADRIIQKDLGASCDYTAPEHPWYGRAVRLGKPVWSTPGFDQAGGACMARHSMPVYSSGHDRRLIGVLTSDVLLPAAP